MTNGRRITRFGQVQTPAHLALRDPDATRPPMATLILVRFGQERGLDEGLLLEGTGLTAEALAEADCPTTARHEFRVLQNLAEAAPAHTAWGLDTGLRYHLTTFGIWGYALISAPTMREAVNVGIRFVDLTSAFTAPTVVQVGEDMGLTFQAPAGTAATRRFSVEREMAYVQVVIESLIGPGTRLKQVAFTHEPDPETLPRYREVFGIEPDFGAERNLVVFDPATLDQPLMHADPHTTRLAQEQCRLLLDKRRARTGLSSAVRDIVISCLPELPSAQEAAARLHLSERTLRRRLAEENTSVRSLVEEVRAGLSADLVLSGILSVAEISQRLGYVETSSFSQAFKRWHGLSARAYAAQHAGA